MDADAKGDAQIALVDETVHPQLYLARRVDGLVGVRKDDHRFVADGLDETPAVAARCVSNEGETLVDRRKRQCVAQLLVEPRASRDIREKHGQRLLGSTHRC